MTSTFDMTPDQRKQMARRMIDEWRQHRNGTSVTYRPATSLNFARYAVAVDVQHTVYFNSDGRRIWWAGEEVADWNDVMVAPDGTIAPG